MNSRINYATFEIKNDINASKDAGAQAASFVINHFVFQVLNWKGAPARHVDFGALKSEGWNRATKLLWPGPNTPIVWPPEEDLDAEAFNGLSSRFKAKPALDAGKR